MSRDWVQCSALVQVHYTLYTVQVAPKYRQGRVQCSTVQYQCPLYEYTVSSVQMPRQANSAGSIVSQMSRLCGPPSRLTTSLYVQRSTTVQYSAARPAFFSSAKATLQYTTVHQYTEMRCVQTVISRVIQLPLLDKKGSPGGQPAVRLEPSLRGRGSCLSWSTLRELHNYNSKLNLALTQLDNILQRRDVPESQ